MRGEERREREEKERGRRARGERNKKERVRGREKKERRRDRRTRGRKKSEGEREKEGERVRRERREGEREEQRGERKERERERGSERRKKGGERGREKEMRGREGGEMRERGLERHKMEGRGRQSSAVLCLTEEQTCSRTRTRTKTRPCCVPQTVPSGECLCLGRKSTPQCRRCVEPPCTVQRCVSVRQQSGKCGSSRVRARRVLQCCLLIYMFLAEGGARGNDLLIVIYTCIVLSFSGVMGASAGPVFLLSSTPDGVMGASGGPVLLLSSTPELYLQYISVLPPQWCDGSVWSGVMGASGGPVVLKKLQGRQNYQGSYSNGVQSQHLSRWTSSFTVTNPQEEPLELGSQTSTTALPAEEPALNKEELSVFAADVLVCVQFVEDHSDLDKTTKTQWKSRSNTVYVQVKSVRTSSITDLFQTQQEDRETGGHFVSVRSRVRFESSLSPV
ncbi:hypothetical protein WMY93_033114 [Mugilogobius chulae]|uniref:LCCL domain-containing protein n=1 Tax=Mugilogobius chulae TaxID=88201 RepID=A0AAW0MPH7_9GOBI